MPEIWTPNQKTVQASPICPVCGGFERGHYEKNHRRLGLAGFHRACCCGPCPGSVQLTYTGVNSGMCTDCKVRFPGHSLKLTGLSLDGTYTVDLIKFDTIKKLCSYKTGKASPSGVGSVGGDIWFASPDPRNCDGAPDEHQTTVHSILVALDVSTDPATVFGVQSQSLLDRWANLVAPAFLNLTGGDLGEALTNEQACLPNSTFLSDSGTATVSL